MREVERATLALPGDHRLCSFKLFGAKGDALAAGVIHLDGARGLARLDLAAARVSLALIAGYVAAVSGDFTPRAQASAKKSFC